MWKSKSWGLARAGLVGEAGLIRNWYATELESHVAAHFEMQSTTGLCLAHMCPAGAEGWFGELTEKKQGEADGSSARQPGHQPLSL